ncbi:MAG TPA: tetratricopeptide repeat protein, partial [Chthoniobacterales bacterium]|nr:tetratricopeptide repeat protein [Chthoniobacterales bacterium]
MACLAFFAMLLLAAAPAENAEREKLFRQFEEGNLESARDIAFRLVANPNRRDFEITSAVDCANAAFLHDYAGDYEQAEPLYLKTLQIAERVAGPDSSLKQAALQSLFALYVNTGRSADAEALARRDPKIGAEPVSPVSPGPLLMTTTRGRDWRTAR